MHLSSINRVLRQNCSHTPLVFTIMLDSELSTVTHFMLFLRMNFHHQGIITKLQLYSLSIYNDVGFRIINGNTLYSYVHFSYKHSAETVAI